MRLRWFVTPVLKAALLLGAPALLADTPFDYRDGLIWIQVTVPQSPNPLHFLLDSGAGVSVINLATARRLGLNVGRPVTAAGVGGTSDGFWPQHLTPTSGDLPLPSDYLAVDLAALSQACTCNVDGLLGVDFFKRRVIEIDFRAARIRCLASSPGTNGAEVVALKLRRQAFLAPVSVNRGKPQWMRLDTGCTAALHWVSRPARETAPKSSLSVGLASLDLPEDTASVQLGSITFPFTQTTVHERPIFLGEAGLLGNGLLYRFDRVTVDAKAGRLLLHNLRASP